MIKVKNIQNVPINQLKPNTKNRNLHPQDQIDMLAKHYKEHGMRTPIIVSNRSGLIVAGHGRYLAAIRAGLKELPVSFQDFDSEQAEYSFGIADNALSSWSELDLSSIHKDLENLEPFDLDLLGIKDFKLEPDPKEGLIDEDEVPEVKESIVKLGDIWQLGEHRLMCGDSTLKENIKLLMDGQKADMVFTDPPYGMFLDTDYSSMKSKFKGSTGGHKYEQIKGDNNDFSPELINTVFISFPDCKEVFLWGADYFAELLPSKNDGSWIVWDKRGDESADKMFGSTFELCWSLSRHKREIARIKWAGIFGMEKEHDKKRVHPTQKPVELVKWFFEKWGNNGDIVIDLYGGSGSTLIACEKTNRKCFMLELDEHYASVIIKRWEQYTGKKAVKIKN